MAGVTDRPFRQLCKRLGAGLAISEMVASNPQLRNTGKSQRRMNHDGEVEPIVVQIAGADPDQMADSARYNVDRGAQIIDINMGCPAKKVCNVAAGSALLQNESLVGAIVERVVNAVDVPVTLKIRTGWDRQHRNAVRIAHIAESAGIAALSAFLFATPNPLNLAPGASAGVTLTGQSARGDVAQTVSWSVSPPQGFSLDTKSGSIALGASARATSKITVTAPSAPGSYTLTFKVMSSLGVTPPPFVLPVVVK